MQTADTPTRKKASGREAPAMPISTITMNSRENAPPVIIIARRSHEGSIGPRPTGWYIVGSCWPLGLFPHQATPDLERMVLYGTVALNRNCQLLTNRCEANLGKNLG